MTALVYALVDPRIPEVIRYVGSTILANKRYNEHLKYGQNEKREWVQNLFDEYVLPKMIELEQCNEDIRWEREAYWSIKYRSEGHPLINRLDGRKPTEETRKRISASGKGKHSMSDEHKAIISATHTGRKRTAAECAAISAGKKGKKFSDEHIANMVASRLGKKASDETKAKISASIKGRSHTKITCPHCGKEGSSSLMKRYHFERCKQQH